MKRLIKVFGIALVMFASLTSQPIAVRATSATIVTSVDDILESGLYHIGDASGLIAMEQFVNRGSGTINHTFQLTQSISLASISFRPIGSGATSFDGIFDGSGFAITGLTFTINTPDESVANQGLFGRVGNQAVIRNVALNDASMTIHADNVTGVGALIGSAADGVTLESLSSANTTVVIHANSGSNIGSLVGQTGAGLSMSELSVINPSITILASGVVGDVGGILGLAASGNGTHLIQSVAFATDRSQFMSITASGTLTHVGGLFGRVDQDNIVVSGIQASFTNTALTLQASGAIQNVGFVAGYLDASQSIAIEEIILTSSMNATIQSPMNVMNFGGFVGQTDSLGSVTASGVTANYTAGSILIRSETSFVNDISLLFGRINARETLRLFDTSLQSSVSLDIYADFILAQVGAIAGRLQVPAEFTGPIEIHSGTWNLQSAAWSITSDFLIGEIAAGIGYVNIPSGLLDISDVQLQVNSNISVQSSGNANTIAGLVGLSQASESSFQRVLIQWDNPFQIITQGTLTSVGGVIGSFEGAIFSPPLLRAMFDKVTLQGTGTWNLSSSGVVSRVGSFIGEDLSERQSRFTHLTVNGPAFQISSNNNINMVGGFIGHLTSGLLEQSNIKTSINFTQGSGLASIGGLIGEAQEVTISGVLARTTMTGLSNAPLTEVAGATGSVSGQGTMQHSMILTTMDAAATWPRLHQTADSLTVTNVSVFNADFLHMIVAEVVTPTSGVAPLLSSVLQTPVSITNNQLTLTWPGDRTSSVLIDWFDTRFDPWGVLSTPVWSSVYVPASNITVSPTSVSLVVGDATTPALDAFTTTSVATGSGVILVTDRLLSTLPQTNNTVTTAGTFVLVRRLFEYNRASGVMLQSSGVVQVIVSAPSSASGSSGGTTTRTLVLQTAVTTLVLEAGRAFVDPVVEGFEVAGAISTNRSSLITRSGIVNATTPGEYLLTYELAFQTLTPATLTITVRVVDTTAPTITAPSEWTTYQLSEDVLPVSVSDLASGAVSVRYEGDISTSTLGTRDITIIATDAAGNVARQQVRVTIREPLVQTVDVSINDQPLSIVVDESMLDLSSLTVQMAIGPAGLSAAELQWIPYNASIPELAPGEVVYVRVLDASGEFVMDQHSFPVEVVPLEATSERVSPIVYGVAIASIMMIAGLGWFVYRQVKP